MDSHWDNDEPRAGACAAHLQDGRVLIAGGVGTRGVLESAELFDVSAGFSSAAAMSSARSTPTCVTLQDGRVLVAGGSDAVAAITSAEIYDPVANAWSPAGDMVYSRSGHTATRLKNGLVLIAGGEGQGAARNTVEIFDPASNSFSLVTSAVLSFSRKEHAAVLLPDGRVLIAGGSDGSNALASTEFYDPATATIALGPSLSSARAGLSATVLLDGNVLIAGGSDGAKDLASAEIFDTSSGKFTAAAQMTTARSGQLAFLLPNNNQVLLIGGDQGNGSAELFTPWRNAFGVTASVQVSSKAAAGAAMGVDGALMVAGGSDGSRVQQSSKVYGFATLKAAQEDYALKITGSGWQPGERVTLLTQNQPKSREDLTRVVAADQTGNITDIQPMAQTAGKFLVTATAPSASGQTGGSTGANLDQCANADGPSGAATFCNSGDPTDWVNGNLGASKARYLEGDSIPYRLVMTNVSTTPTVTHHVTIQWDTTKGGKHALDYLTSFNQTVTTADPCAGVTCVGTAQDPPFAIPPDPNLANGFLGSQIAGAFTMYGGNITGVSTYSLSGSYGGDSSTSITIAFTATSANLVLAWGGHIATRVDWGTGNSAIAISGSPYHTRLLDLDGSGGNQDRSLSSDATIFPATIRIIKSASVQSETEFDFTTTGGLANFMLFDNGGTGISPGDTTPNTQVFTVTNFTTYTVSETLQSAWALSFQSPACSLTSPNGGSFSVNNPTVSISLKEGENWTCTFVNTAKTATVKLQKSLSPANDPGRFDLTVNSTTTLTNGDGGSAQASVAVGATATLSEAASSGNLALTNYTSGLACPAGITVNPNTGTSGSFTVPLSAAGTTITCTVTNTRKTLTLTLKKTLSPSDDPGTFDLKIGTTTVKSGAKNGDTGSLTVNAGDSVPISELGHTGTTLSFYGSVLACDNSISPNPNTGTSGTILVPAIAGPVTCTFTNTRKTLTLIVKKSVPTANDPGLFNLSINGSIVSQAAGVGNNGSGQTTVNVGDSASISEAAHAGTSLSSYSSTLACDSSVVPSPNANTSGTIVVPNIAGPVTCTFTNTNVTATLTVTKVCAASSTDQGAGTLFPTVINQGVTLKASFSLTCTGTTRSDTETLVGGSGTGTTYTVVETPPNPWQLGGALPTGWSSPGTFAGDCDVTSGQVTLKSGDQKTCFILNVISYCTPAFPPGSSAPTSLIRQALPASRGTRVQRPARSK